MKIFRIILAVIAIALIIYNATKLNFDALLEGESMYAVITILAAICAIMILQILRISKRIEKLHKTRK